MAEKALKEIPSSSCLVCGKSFSPDDVIIINGRWLVRIVFNHSDEERKVLRERMLARRKCERKSVGVPP